MLTFRVKINRLLLPLFLLTAAAPLTHAATLDYSFHWNAVRGTVTAAGTSLGAFTLLPDYWSYQGQTGVAPAPLTNFLFSSSMVEPGLATVRSYSFPNMTSLPDPVFAASFYLPYYDPADPSTAKLGWYTYDPNGAFNLNVTVASNTSVRYSGNYAFLDPLGNAGTASFTGIVALGSGDPRLDTFTDSLAFRTATTLITAKVTGTAQTPEPGTFLSGGLGIALLLGTLFARRRRLPSAA